MMLKNVAMLPTFLALAAIVPLCSGQTVLMKQGDETAANPFLRHHRDLGFNSGQGKAAQKIATDPMGFYDKYKKAKEKGKKNKGKKANEVYSEQEVEELSDFLLGVKEKIYESSDDKVAAENYILTLSDEVILDALFMETGEPLGNFKGKGKALGLRKNVGGQGNNNRGLEGGSFESRLNKEYMMQDLEAMVAEYDMSDPESIDLYLSDLESVINDMIAASCGAVEPAFPFGEDRMLIEDACITAIFDTLAGVITIIVAAFAVPSGAAKIAAQSLANSIKVVAKTAMKEAAKTYVEGSATNFVTHVVDDVFLENVSSDSFEEAIEYAGDFISNMSWWEQGLFWIEFGLSIAAAFLTGGAFLIVKVLTLFTTMLGIVNNIAKIGMNC